MKSFRQQLLYLPTSHVSCKGRLYYCNSTTTVFQNYNISGFPYTKDTVSQLGLPYTTRPSMIVEIWRKRVDLGRIEVLNLWIDRVQIGLCTFHVIDCESVHARGHNLRLYEEHCNVNCRLNAFVCRNVNV